MFCNTISHCRLNVRSPKVSCSVLKQRWTTLPETKTANIKINLQRSTLKILFAQSPFLLEKNVKRVGKNPTCKIVIYETMMGRFYLMVKEQKHKSTLILLYLK